MTRENQQSALLAQLAKARRALEEAEYILKGGFADAAISRAYYCVFHAARSALIARGVQPKSHRGVNDRFNAELVETGLIEAEFLSILGREQRDREIADYSVEQTITLELAAKRTAEARVFLARIETFLAGAGWKTTPE